LKMKVKMTFLLLVLGIGLFITTPTIADQGDPKRLPRVVVFNGNGAYHTSIDGLTTNASVWGYEVISVNYLNDAALTNAEILILNGPDFLSAADKAVVTTWWGLGGKTLWYAADSDYGGYWNPADINELVVDLGGDIILVDDAISDPVSQDGASYRVVANTTNAVDFGGLINGYSPAITNVSMHGPTYVAPWTGDNTGNVTANPAGQAKWTDVAGANWIINSSKYATVQDQDGDDDDVWEGVAPLSNGSLAMVAVQDGLAGGNKMVAAGESFYADYKEMFGYLARYANHSIQNINLTHGLLKWSYDPVNAPAKTRPTVYVWTGNGGYHTSVEGLVRNATQWGYDVFASTFWVDVVLEMTDILILNAPDYLTDFDVNTITTWWNTGNRSLWFIGESDYGGYWDPADLNALAVDLGSKVIIVDDAISDPVSQDGASYRVVANQTNPAGTWDAVLRSWATDVTNVSMHGPTYVHPWNGDNEGNAGAGLTWAADADIDWIVNSSKYATVQDQDGDDDALWEGVAPLTNASLAMVAAQWNAGPWGDSNMVFAGESFFADYKEMFGYVARYANHSIQNINLTHGMLDWATPANLRYYQIADDMYAPAVEMTGDNTHLVGDADYLYDNEAFNMSFMIHDFPNAYSGLSKLYVAYDAGDGEEMAELTQSGFNSFFAVFGPFDADTDVSYYVFVQDQAGWMTYSETMSFSVEYSDTLGPEIEASLSQTADVYDDVAVTVTATVTETADEEEIISGIDEVVIEYSTDGGTTWMEATVTGTYTATLPTFAVGTTVQVRVTASDLAGNEETSDVLSFTVVAKPVTTTTTTTSQGGPGFELIFGLVALVGAAAFINRRKR
jgi:PGF-CTERM protein